MRSSGGLRRRVGGRGRSALEPQCFRLGEVITLTPDELGTLDRASELQAEHGISDLVLGLDQMATRILAGDRQHAMPPLPGACTRDNVAALTAAAGADDATSADRCSTDKSQAVPSSTRTTPTADGDRRSGPTMRGAPR